jgi:hypothetical protein
MKRRGIDLLQRNGLSAVSESFGLKSVGILQGLGASLGEKRVGCHGLEAHKQRASSAGPRCKATPHPVSSVDHPLPTGEG